MQTFLLVSQDQIFIKEEIKKLKDSLKISSFNTHEFNPAPSIGIEQVRKIKEYLKLKSFDGGERLIILYELDKATPEAGNALLKLLEEPPSDTYIILTCTNINHILPTVVSRCQIKSNHRLKPSTNLSASDVKTSLSLLDKIISSNDGERLLISSESARSKESTVALLDSFLVCLENLLHGKNDLSTLNPSNIALLLTKISIARKYIEKNINYKATLDILLLGFPRTKKSVSHP